jgi:SAM-dependent methyltransferase
MEKRTYALLYEVEDAHWWFVTRRKMVRALLARYASPHSKVLEIGCGTAATLSMLAKEGYQVAGLDMSTDAQQFAAERSIPVAIGSADALPYPDHQFDVVLLLDVIEHIAEDTVALAEAARVLRPGGIVVLFTPAYMWMWGRQDRISHHQRRYTQSVLRKRIPLTLRVEKISYFNTFLFPLIALIRVFTETFHLQLPDENRMNAPWVNRICATIFGWEVPVVSRISLPFGVSLMLVAKKHEPMV